jgi:hypothetical protein
LISGSESTTRNSNGKTILRKRIQNDDSGNKSLESTTDIIMVRQTDGSTFTCGTVGCTFNSQGQVSCSQESHQIIAEKSYEGTFLRCLVIRPGLEYNTKWRIKKDGGGEYFYHQDDISLDKKVWNLTAGSGNTTFYEY